MLLDHDDRQLLSRYDLSVARFYALLHLGEEPGLSISELSALMLCDKSNTSRLIKGMEADGLVLRQVHESDRRMLRLFLTSAGMKLRGEVLDVHDQNNECRFDDSLTRTEQETLFVSLDKLTQSLRTRVSVIEN